MTLISSKDARPSRYEGAKEVKKESNEKGKKRLIEGSQEKEKERK